MEYVTTLEELEEKLQTIVYKPSFDSKNCSVCTVDKPIVEKLQQNMNFLHTLQKLIKVQK